MGTVVVGGRGGAPLIALLATLALAGPPRTDHVVVHGDEEVQSQILERLEGWWLPAAHHVGHHPHGRLHVVVRDGPVRVDPATDRLMVPRDVADDALYGALVAWIASRARLRRHPAVDTVAFDLRGGGGWFDLGGSAVAHLAEPVAVVPLEPPESVVVRWWEGPPTSPWLVRWRPGAVVTVDGPTNPDVAGVVSLAAMPRVGTATVQAQVVLGEDHGAGLGLSARHRWLTASTTMAVVQHRTPMALREGLARVGWRRVQGDIDLRVIRGPWSMDAGAWLRRDDVGVVGRPEWIGTRGAVRLGVSAVHHAVEGRIMGAVRATDLPRPDLDDGEWLDDAAWAELRGVVRRRHVGDGEGVELAAAVGFQSANVQHLDELALGGVDGDFAVPGLPRGVVTGEMVAMAHARVVSRWIGPVRLGAGAGVANAWSHAAMDGSSGEAEASGAAREWPGSRPTDVGAPLIPTMDLAVRLRAFVALEVGLGAPLVPIARAITDAGPGLAWTYTGLHGGTRVSMAPRPRLWVTVGVLQPARDL